MICIGKSAMDCYEEIEKLIDMGHEKIWFCMYHDLLGSGKYGC